MTATDRIDDLTEKIGLLVLVIRSIDINETQFVLIDVYVRDEEETAVFICSGFQDDIDA